MAYKGAIQYLDLPFGRVEWEENDVHSPWSGRPAGTWTYSRDRSNYRQALTVTVRSFDTQAASEFRDAIILDDPANWIPLVSTIKCVILGKLKSEVKGLQKNGVRYVLLVAPADSNGSQDTQAYNRVGVGIMPFSLFSTAGPGSHGQVY